MGRISREEDSPIAHLRNASLVHDERAEPLYFIFLWFRVSWEENFELLWQAFSELFHGEAHRFTISNPPYLFRSVVLQSGDDTPMLWVYDPLGIGPFVRVDVNFYLLECQRPSHFLPSSMDAH